MRSNVDDATRQGCSVPGGLGAAVLGRLLRQLASRNPIQNERLFRFAGTLVLVGKNQGKNDGNGLLLLKFNGQSIALSPQDLPGSPAGLFDRGQWNDAVRHFDLVLIGVVGF
jgi:hypothetical protein